MAESIVNFFKNEHNLNVLKKLEDAGVKMERESTKPEIEQYLEDKSFVFTGALDNYTRKEASELVRKFGGSVKSSVSSKTSYLVVGDNPGSKYNQAQELGVDILEENDFESLVKGGS